MHGENLKLNVLQFMSVLLIRSSHQHEWPQHVADDRTGNMGLNMNPRES